MTVHDIPHVTATCPHPDCIGHTHGKGSLPYLRAVRDVAVVRYVKARDEADTQLRQADAARWAIANLPCDAARTDDELVQHLRLGHSIDPNPDFLNHRSRLDQIHEAMREANDG